MKLLRTIDPADVRAAERFHARCLSCPWTMRAKFRETLDVVGEGHVSTTRHGVVIEEEETT